jgi:MFS family permease
MLAEQASRDLRHSRFPLSRMPGSSDTGLDSSRAWIIVFAVFAGASVTFGLSYRFGLFLRPMASEFHAAMSAVFSTITVLSFFAAPCTGKIANRHGSRPVVAAGAIVVAGIAVYVSLACLPAFAIDFGTTREVEAALLGYIGASSVLGRLGLNALAPVFVAAGAAMLGLIFVIPVRNYGVCRSTALSAAAD